MTSPANRRRRGAVNVIEPGVLYQRGQILTWPLEKKRALFREYDIKTVVNLWTKLDPNLDECELDAYHFLPLPDSSRVTDPRIFQTARQIAYQLGPGKAALVLCEAGKTRSVYFCALIMMSLRGISGAEALALMRRRVPGSALKPGMIHELEDLV